MACGTPQAMRTRQRAGVAGPCRERLGISSGRLDPFRGPAKSAPVSGCDMACDVPQAMVPLSAARIKIPANTPTGPAVAAVVPGFFADSKTI